MIIHAVVQGTSTWLALRSGIPTASAFDRIITAKTRKPSTQAGAYMNQLLAERIMGHPCEEFSSKWMDRGKALEERAVAYYSMLTGDDTTPVGFVTNDSWTIGASPDRFVGASGILEIKCPKESTHVGYLLDAEVDAEYYPQVQGQLWIAEREWADVLAYHPELPPALIRVRRDEEYISLLRDHVESFSEKLERAAERLKAKGWIRDLEVAS